MPIDTLAAAFCLEDENDNAAAAALMKRLADFGNERDLLVMPIAHLGKNAEAGTRGASAFGAGADAVLSVLANSDPVKGVVTSRSLVLSKLRRGSTGPLGFFELEEVNLGEDADGDAVTSCFVNFDIDRTAAIEGDRSFTGRGDRLFIESLDESLAEAGSDYRTMGNGPIVRAVQVQSVRNRFMLRYATGEPDEKQQNANRNAWKRAFDKMGASGIIASDAADSRGQMVWRVRAPRA